MIRHRVERHNDQLRITLDVDLAEIAAGLHDQGAAGVLERYCLRHVVPDALEVTEILLREDSVQGVVRWFNDQLGYGFIRSYDGQDVFVHYSNIAGSGYRTLEQGQRVRFKYRAGRQLSAADVEPLEATAEEGL